MEEMLLIKAERLQVVSYAFLNSDYNLDISSYAQCQDFSSFITGLHLRFDLMQPQMYIETFIICCSLFVLYRNQDLNQKVWTSVAPL